MQPVDQIVIYSLVGLNVALYGLLAGTLLKRRYFSKPTVSSIVEAFQLLEVAVQERVPELPEGFTWRDAISRLRRHNLSVDWGKIDEALADYESCRYGPQGLSSGDPREVLRLASQLGRSSKFVERP